MGTFGGSERGCGPFLIRGLLLRLAVLVHEPCTWNIDLDLLIRPFVVGGSGRSKRQSRFTYPPGYVGSLPVVLRAVVAPNYPGAAPCLVVFVQSNLHLNTLISCLFG